jgi:hypothetical protein
MILALHLAAAASSLMYVGYLMWRPSQPGFYIAYLLVALTIASGTALVIIKRPEHMATVCTEGLVYLALMAIGIIVARVKFRKHVLLAIPKNS